MLREHRVYSFLIKLNEKLGEYSVGPLCMQKGLPTKWKISLYLAAGRHWLYTNYVTKRIGKRGHIEWSPGSPVKMQRGLNL